MFHVEHCRIAPPNRNDFAFFRSRRSSKRKMFHVEHRTFFSETTVKRATPSIPRSARSVGPEGFGMGPTFLSIVRPRSAVGCDSVKLGTPALRHKTGKAQRKDQVTARDLPAAHSGALHTYHLPPICRRSTLNPGVLSVCSVTGDLGFLLTVKTAVFPGKSSKNRLCEPLGIA